jgi:DNA-binding MarR family transcriptional regulator
MAAEVTMLPQDVGALCFGLHSRMTARAVSRAYNDRFRPLDLQGTQFSLLVAVNRAADVPIAALADHLGAEASTLLRNLKIMEARGLIAGGGGRGRRGRRLRLTPAGEALLARAMPIWLEIQADMTEALGDDFAAVHAALERLEAAALQLEQTRPGQAAG